MLKLSGINLERVSDMKKCDYCAKEITYFDQYCSDECHAKANKYYETAEKFGKIFSIINAICVFGIPAGLFLLPFSKMFGAVIATVSCVILGIMLILLPFPTDDMISKHKLQNAIKRTRILAVLIIVLGVLILGLSFIIK